MKPQNVDNKTGSEIVITINDSANMQKVIDNSNARGAGLNTSAKQPPNFSKKYTELVSLRNSKAYQSAVKAMIDVLCGCGDKCDIFDVFLLRGVTVISTVKGSGVILAPETCPVVMEMTYVTEFGTYLKKQISRKIWGPGVRDHVIEIAAFVCTFTMMRSFTAKSQFLAKLPLEVFKSNETILAITQHVIHASLADNMETTFQKICGQSTTTTTAKPIDPTNEPIAESRTTTTTTTAKLSDSINDLVTEGVITTTTPPLNVIKQNTTTDSLFTTTAVSYSEESQEEMLKWVNNTKLIGVCIIHRQTKTGHLFKTPERFNWKTCKCEENVAYSVEKGSAVSNMLAEYGWKDEFVSLIDGDVNSGVSIMIVSAKILCTVYAAYLIKMITQNRANNNNNKQTL